MPIPHLWRSMSKHGASTSLEAKKTGSQQQENY